MQQEDLSTVLLRRLHRAELDNALVHKKAQRLVALRALSRSLQLRQELIHARQARAKHQNFTEDENGMVPTPPPPLDPSVKALIEKLTEIAELLPPGMNREVPSAPSQVTLDGVDDDDDNNDMETKNLNAHVPKIFTKHNRPDASQRKVADSSGLHQSQRGADAGGWGDEEESRPVRERSTEKGKQEHVVTQEAGDDSIHASRARLLVEEIDPENATIGQRLNEIDATVEYLFRDLEEKSKQPTNGQENDRNRRQEDPNQAEAEKKCAEEARKRQRVLYVAQLGRKKMANVRRPRWRWIADGISNPPPDQVLGGRSFWRAAVFLVIIFFIRPKRSIIQRKARSKERDMQDWHATLAIYFDRCQTWLLKTSRVPVANSILKSPKLSFRLGRIDGKSEAYTTASRAGKGGGGGKSISKRGFVSSLLGAVGRGMTHENVTMTLMRIKVHAKGVMRGLTQEMPPSDIVTFFSYLAGDSNYFPDGFFFAEEAKVIYFDELGAVRKLAEDMDPPDNLEHTLYALHPSNDLKTELDVDAKRHHEGFFEAHHLLGWLAHDHTKDGQEEKADAVRLAARPMDLRAAVLHGKGALPGKLRSLYRHDTSGRWLDTRLVEMVLTNYLMVRVLVPWILLYPHESGLIPSSGVKPSLLAHNCQVLASIVYLIVRVLRPELTPPNVETQEATALEGVERARRQSRQVRKVAREQREDGKDSGNESGDNDLEDEKRGDERKTLKEAEGAAKGKLKDKQNKTQRQPLRVQEIMRQKRSVSLSDKQLVQGLLPDAYFMPFAEQLRPWVLEQAAEFDTWMQNVVVMVMRKSINAIRQEKTNKESVD